MWWHARVLPLQMALPESATFCPDQKFMFWADPCLEKWSSFTLDPIGVQTYDLASKKLPKTAKMCKKSIFWVLVALQCRFVTSKDKILYTIMKKLY